MQRDDMLVTFADVSDFTVPWYLHDFSLQDFKCLNNTEKENWGGGINAKQAQLRNFPSLYQAYF